MSYGSFRVFNEKGSVILDTSHAIMKQLGTFSKNDKAGSVYDSRMVGANIWFFLKEAYIDTDKQGIVFPVEVTADSKKGTISWPSLQEASGGSYGGKPVIHLTETYVYGIY